MITEAELLAVLFMTLVAAVVFRKLGVRWSTALLLSAIYPALILMPTGVNYVF